MANRLNWSLGHPGKGNVYSTGDISTWNIGEYEEPHHLEQRNLENQDEIAFKFYITPEGEIHDGGLGFENQTPESDDQIIKEIVEQDPALHDARQEVSMGQAPAPRVEEPGGGFGHAQNLLDIMSKIGVSSEGWPEFHTEFKLPRHVRRKIRQWVDRLDWPEGSEQSDARTYHITVLSMDEYDDKFAEWAKDQVKGRVFSFKTIGMDIFEGSVVLRVECPEWFDLAVRWGEMAEGRGLEPRRFPGGPKAHITIGTTTDGKWPQGVPDPHLEFDTRTFNVNRNSKVSNELTPQEELKLWLDSFKGEQPSPLSIHHQDESQIQPQTRPAVAEGPFIDPPSHPYKPYNWADEGFEESPMDRTSGWTPEHILDAVDSGQLAGPYMYHWTHPHKEQQILEQGILPWDAPISDPPGSKWEKQDLQPRPGHTYLTTQSYKEPADVEEHPPFPGAVGNPGKSLRLKIDLTKLDPERLRPDEDAGLGDALRWRNIPGHEDIQHEQAVNRDYSRGQWAEDNRLNHPQMISDSLDRLGTLAYQGSIPPEAIVDTHNIHNEGVYSDPDIGGVYHDPDEGAYHEAADIDTHSCPQCGEQIEGNVCDACGYNAQNADSDFKAMERNWYDRSWKVPDSARPFPPQPEHWRHDNARDIKFSTARVASDQQDNGNTPDNGLFDIPTWIEHHDSHEDQRNTIHGQTYNDDSREDSNDELDNLDRRNGSSTSPWDAPQQEDNLHPLWAEKRHTSGVRGQTDLDSVPQVWRDLSDSTSIDG